MKLNEKEEIKEFEEKYKKRLFEDISILYLSQAKMINEIKKTEEYIDLDTDLPNIGITFNNKLIELSQIFKEAGISMFSQKVEKYELLKADINELSFVGDAIIRNMLEYLVNTTQILNEYIIMMTDITEKKKNKIEVLQKENYIQKLFFKIKGLLYLKNKEEISYTKEEIDIANSYLANYKEKNEQLHNYTLRNNIVDSLVSDICVKQYDEFTVVLLLKEIIIPALQKLGLSDLIPELKKDLSKKLKNDEYCKLYLKQKVNINEPKTENLIYNSRDNSENFRE